jgi:hypothetical protein
MSFQKQNKLIFATHRTDMLAIHYRGGIYKLCNVNVIKSPEDFCSNNEVEFLS